MINLLYKIFKTQAIDLARSIIIKDDLVALSVNRYLKEINVPVNTEDKSTWKYYLNLAGERHPTDPEITIKSHDTLQEIPFTKESLVINKTTLVNYKKDRSLVKKLVSEYPFMEIYIKGVMSPVPLEKSIDSNNGTILYYEKSLVEINEYSLINDLQQWVDSIYYRWYVDNRFGFNDLISAGFIGVLYSLLPGKILSLRRARCRTNEVHSYHIREYLSSFGQLDKYLDVLTKKQQLFLYRNLLHLRNNSGKQKTLSLLIDKLLTEINIPLFEYNIIRTVEESEDGDVSIHPVLRQGAINTETGRDLDTIFTPLDILEKERDIARDNEFTETETDKRLKSDILYSSSSLRTKILESDILDVGENSPYILNDTLLNHWLYLANLDLYETYLSFNSPKSKEAIVLNSKDAAILFLYCGAKAVGITLDEISPVTVCNVRELTLPSVEELTTDIEDRFIAQAMIDEIYAENPEIGTYHSPGVFREFITTLHYRLQRHRRQYNNIGNYVKYTQVRAGILKLYKTVKIQLGTGLYSDWLTEKGIDLEGFSRLDYKFLSEEIAKKAIATPDNEKSLGDIQTGVIKILSQLSSYSIQFITNINDNPLISSDNTGPSVGDHLLSSNHLGHILDNYPKIIGCNLSSSMKADIFDKPIIRVDKLHSYHTVNIDTNVNVIASGRQTQTFNALTTIPSIMSVEITEIEGRDYQQDTIEVNSEFILTDMTPR